MAIQLRLRVGLNQREISAALGMRQGTISDWETGKSIPTLTPSKFRRMLEVYQCTVDELVDAFESPPQMIDVSTLQEVAEE